MRTVHLYRIAAAWPACENLGEGCSCYCYRAKVRSTPRGGSLTITQNKSIYYSVRLGFDLDEDFNVCL